MRSVSLFAGVGACAVAVEHHYQAQTVCLVEGIEPRPSDEEQRALTAFRSAAHPVAADQWDAMQRNARSKLAGEQRQGEYNRAVLRRHFPDALILADVRDVGAHNLPQHEILEAGFPCTDLSVAGRGDGLDGDKSGLYAEVLRIVGECAPQIVLIENVPALLKYRTRLELDFAAIGYGLTFATAAAAHTGAPHRRARVFVLATKGGTHRGVADAGPYPVPTVANWPTPRASENGGRGKRRRDNEQYAKQAGATLAESVQPAEWPTPVSGQNESMRNMRGNPTLKGAVRPAAEWPTPTTPGGGAKARSGARGDERLLNGAVLPTNWPTARASDADKAVRTRAGCTAELERKGAGCDLPTAAGARAANWPTPRASEAKGGDTQTRHGVVFATLRGAVKPAANWPTPAAQNPAIDPARLVDKNGDAPEHWQQRLYDRETGRVAQKGLTQVVQPAVNWATPCAADHRDRNSFWTESARKRREAGKQENLSSQLGGKLNPQWVAMLQGLPPTWCEPDGDSLRDVARQLIDAPLWPAPMIKGQWGDSPQYPHEPPRAGPTAPNRSNQLRALGNLNPPQLYVLALHLLERGPRQISLF